jgi:hypothetical protein
VQLVRSAQAALAAARDRLAAAAVLYPEGMGGLGQGDIFLAALAPSEGHPVAAHRGLSDPLDLQDAVHRLRGHLGRLIVATRPRLLLLSVQEAALWGEALVPLRTALSEFSDDIHPILHLAGPARALADRLALRAQMGLATGIGPEELAAVAPEAVARHWAGVFGAEVLRAREFADGPVGAEDVARVLADLALADPALAQALHGVAGDVLPHGRPSIPALRRIFALNAALRSQEAVIGPLPATLRDPLLAGLLDDAPGLAAADLAGGLDGPAAPDLSPDGTLDLTPLLADLPARAAALRSAAEAARADRLAAQGAESTARAVARPAAEASAPPPRRRGPEPHTPAGEAILSPTAKEVFRNFAGGRYWPRNTGVVSLDETADLPPFPVAEPPRTGTLIVGCMKNEGPYVLEWVAYHKAIGVDHFLIFTNDCADHTDDILIRLGELGHVTHVRNDEWKGKSPQQAALNKAMKMDVVKEARWLIHIDVDEFINVRVGNGTLADLYAGMGEATNLAMTWRLFGNGGVEEIGDASVIDRFTGCAPAYVPKPHTMWGFKSITRNVGAYDKLSCHRPNHLAASHKKTVRWLNGNLKDHTKELAEKGWRSSIQSIGYDAVQLNHYALRSRESFLIKRQRGRALHVDRSIGLNYWVRHDWHLNTDRTILRQLPRLQAMKAALLEDPVLARLQAQALDWHHAKAAELRGTEAFAELWDQTKRAELSDGERMAFAVAEDMES